MVQLRDDDRNPLEPGCRRRCRASTPKRSHRARQGSAPQPPRRRRDERRWLVLSSRAVSLARSRVTPWAPARSQPRGVHTVLVESGVHDVVGLGSLVAAFPVCGRTRGKVSDEIPKEPPQSRHQRHGPHSSVGARALSNRQRTARERKSITGSRGCVTATRLTSHEGHD